MPPKKEMNWDGDRWRKKLNGVPIYVGPRTLKKEFPDLFKSNTEEGSREAANAWWLKFVEQKAPVTTELDRAIEIMQTHVQVAELEGNEFRATALRGNIEVLRAEKAKKK